MSTASESGRIRASVSDFDHHDARLCAADVWRIYAAMREACPVAHSDRHGGFDMVTRYDDVRHVAAEPEVFSSSDGVLLPRPPLDHKAPPLEFDPPEHSLWRSFMNHLLQPRSVRAQQGVIAEICGTLIDRFAGDGGAELVSMLAEPFPSLVIGRLVGLDSDESYEMREKAMAFFDSVGSPDFDVHGPPFLSFLGDQLADRRARPREDYLTKLVSSDFDGRPLTRDEGVSVLIALLVGGHHSTAAAFASLLYHVMTVPGLRERLLSEPALVPRAIEESLRLSTPLHLFRRTVRRDAIVAGVPIPAGRPVLINYASANRDERAFDGPDEFRIDRVSNRHVAFGHGIHTCQGSHLARTELKVALTEVLRRLPDLRLDGEAEWSGLIGGKLLTITRLPVAFSPERPG